MSMSSRDVAGYGRLEINARFRRPLMSFFLRRVASHAEAEDLTQQVFVRLLASERDGSAAAPLVFRIAANLLRDRHRVTARRGEHLPLLEDDEATAWETEDLTPERVLLSRETLSEVLHTLDQLGERTRDMLILFRLENMSHAEIAALFGCSRSTVEKHIMKATCHLLLRHKAE